MSLDLDAILHKLLSDSCADALRDTLSEHTVRQACFLLQEQLVQLQNVIHISSPVTVVGDVHGQFFDLLEAFKVGGPVPETNYLLLGDYVDRGHHSVETICLLIFLKLRFPTRVHMLRGNHESRQISQVYGFYDECSRKFGNANIWKYITDAFDFLPIAALIDGCVFAVHGGLSPDMPLIDQLKVINRFQEIPHEGPLADIMWSDPHPSTVGFSFSDRGAGYVFGSDIVERFCAVNHVRCILRAHQLCMAGFQSLFDERLHTVWSAPNYCYRCGNEASILEVSETLELSFNVFSSAPASANIKPAAAAPPAYFL